MTIDPKSLTRFQRMLVGTDGTVTRILEAYAEEPIDVRKVLQRIEPADGVDGALEMLPGEEVLRRQVVLRGRRSGRSLLYAEALVAVARVEPPLLNGLVTTDRPIGELLAEHRTETFREILRVEQGHAGPFGAHLGIDEGAGLISRTYRILVRRQPVMLITERFPADSFRDLPA